MSQLDGSVSKEAKALYIDALDAIAEHTTSPSLKQAVMELRHLHGVDASDATNGSTTTESKAVNFNLPVGLHNIGNTCYLNSLLQYLFTVNPIRDIVLNYDNFRLDLTDEGIQSRRLGGNKMQMDRGEAVVAQACKSYILFRTFFGEDYVTNSEFQLHKSWPHCLKTCGIRTRPQLDLRNGWPMPCCYQRTRFLLVPSHLQKPRPLRCRPLYQHVHPQCRLRA